MSHPELLEDLIDAADDDVLAAMQQRIETAIEDRRRIATNAFLADEATLEARLVEIETLIYQDATFKAHQDYLQIQAEYTVASASLGALKIAVDAAGVASHNTVKAHRLATRPLAQERLSIRNQLRTLQTDRKRKLEVMEAAELK